MDKVECVACLDFSTRKCLLIRLEASSLILNSTYFFGVLSSPIARLTRVF